MRVLVTGATGFVGRWLVEELAANGHEVVGAPPSLDVTDASAVAGWIAAAHADAIAHLAAVAFAPDAAADPGTAYAVAIGGTTNVLEAARACPIPPAVLVTGSAEVYGLPHIDDLPLRETAPVRPRSPYALSKLAQEGVTLAYAARFGLRAVVTRSFNHTGPGQRATFVVPALAERVRAVAAGTAREIPVGNLDVRRDISDVRDVAAAYRLLLEVAVSGGLPAGGTVVNVCSGRAVSIRSILDELCRSAGVTPSITVDPALVRVDDPAEICGDPSALAALTGWRVTTPLETTLADVWASITQPTPA